MFLVLSGHSKAAGRMTREGNIEQVPENRIAVDPDLYRKIENQEVLRVLRSLPEHYQAVLVLIDVESSVTGRFPKY